jgi:hypothetical protein
LVAPQTAARAAGCNWKSGKPPAQSDRDESPAVVVESQQAQRGSDMKKKIGLAVGAIGVVLLGFGGKYVYDNFTVELPKYQPINNAD